MNPAFLMAIAAGGAVGALGRYLVMVWAGHAWGLGFPFGTLAVNILGSFALGSLIEGVALSWTIGQDMRAFLVVGVLGSFTTFSNFSLDVVILAERGEVAAVALYMGLTVFVGVSALFAGMFFTRHMIG